MKLMLSVQLQLEVRQASWQRSSVERRKQRSAAPAEAVS